ncbi:MAG: alanine--glyoxylate aminotransferase family protein, partial [SAR202 cluster bacterium]|nr:alanine--glyoxylate aminotransferase family protein [SAR202 cluster bacterium]
MTTPSVGELNPPARLLLGPGPANIPPRVLRAMTAPLLGYLDPDFLKIMDDVAAMLRIAFGTKEGFTLPVSGTGSAGMEAGLANLLEPGDTVVVLDAGFFGDRLVEMAGRLQANVV